MAVRTYDLGLDVLDRQILDSENTKCGNVDDIELDFTDGRGKPPVVTAILASPGAWGPRLRRFGGAVVALWRRLHPHLDPKPLRIEWGEVAKLDYAIHLRSTAEELGLTRAEDWVRERIISKIPGA